ncbi:MAG: class I SAM-dependent methyltransferase [bacterium]|nr:class I SAM-dependent methyltransferase [bacterium]
MVTERRGFTMTYKKDTVDGFFCPSKIFMQDAKEAQKPDSPHNKITKTCESGFFDWLAPHYDRLQPAMDPSRYQAHSIILDILNTIEPEPEKFLDLGCHTGMLTSQILELFPEAHVVAIDGSIAMLEEARINLEEFSDRITLAKADFRDRWEDAIDGDVDVIVHYASLCYIPHDALREVYTRLVKILKPGGWFLHCDLTEERLPEPVKRIAANIREYQRNSVVDDIPDGERLLKRLEQVKNANVKKGRLVEIPALPEQQIAWLVGAGFEFATRIYQDWRLSLFLARKPE